MLTVTAKAAEKMREALKLEDKPEWGLRLVAQPGSCNCCGPTYGLFPEKEAQPEDVVIAQGGVNIFVDPSSMALLEGATIDFISHPEQGEGFAIENPAHQHGEGECTCSH
jgi:iron-sulfur cluster assembly protein